MGNINKFLLMAIAMVAIMIAAVGIDRGVQHYNDQKWEKERVARYEQAYADVADIQMQISQLAKDREAIEAFIEENRGYFDSGDDAFMDNVADENTSMPDNSMKERDEASENEEDEDYGVSENELDIEASVSENQPGEGSVSGNEPWEGGSVSGNGPWENGSVSGNEPWESESVSGNGLWESGSVSGNEPWEGEGVSGNGLWESGSVSGNESWESGSVSGNGSGEGVSGNGLWESESISGNESGNAYEVSGNGMDNAEMIPSLAEGSTLSEKRKIRGSYMETQMQNKIDMDVVAGNSFDFSDISITCIGDSITEGSNLDSMENYQQYSYPARLKELLGAEKVTNLGIGGSSIGRYWENAFVDRFREIPVDTDLIVVMGGTNDGFCMSQEELGTIQERKSGTFIGDLDELMRGLKETYPAAEIVFVTPLPNILHDMLRKERDYLLPQSVLANTIIQLATEYDIHVIDLYNSNILDTHDAAIIYNYMPDGVHCNSDGYNILAQHLAAELIKIYSGVDMQAGDIQEPKEQEGDIQEPEEQEGQAEDI